MLVNRELAEAEKAGSKMLPGPRARQYSISSAAEAQSEAALTVSVVEDPAKSGNGTFRS